MPVEIVKFGRENVCFEYSSGLFWGPCHLCRPHGAAQKHATLGRRDGSSSETSVNAMANATDAVPRT
jgi:hypothetical protein